MTLPFVLPRVIGHRGMAGLAPENTLPAFAAAHASGLSWVELDAKLCGSGEVIVLHDNSVQRTSNGHGRAAQMSFKQLQTIDAGAWFDRSFHGTRIPLLRDVLDFCSAHDMGINIELKPNPDQYAATASAVISLLRAGNYPARLPLLLSSFSLQSLRAAKRLAPELPRGLLLEHQTTLAMLRQKVRDVGAHSVHLNAQHLDLRTIAALRNDHLEVLAWTVNDERQAMAWYAHGVTAVFSDFPIVVTATN